MRKKNKKLRIAPAGFTLVELLVVISIIALLMSILMPSLQKARESARTVACLSNLKQLSTVVYTYSVNNDGWSLPTAKNGAGSRDAASPTWYERLKNQKYIEYIPYDGVNPNSGNAGILHCPSDRRNKAAYSYSANRHVMGFEVPRNPTEEILKVKRLSVMRRPSELIMLGERGAMNPGEQALLDNIWSPAGSSVWSYLGNNSNGAVLGFFAGRHGRANLTLSGRNEATINRAAIPFALADGHASVFRGNITTLYDSHMPRSGFDIDRGYLAASKPPEGWPRMVP